MMILMLGPSLPVSVVMAVVHRVLPIEPDEIIWPRISGRAMS
jgi:hypothetical protein